MRYFAASLDPDDAYIVDPSGDTFALKFFLSLAYSDAKRPRLEEYSEIAEDY